MTARGFGGIVRSPRKAPTGAAGVLTLDNGLTLTGTNGQLGGPLIQLTDIALAGNTFTMSSFAGGNVIFLDDTFGAQLASFGFDSGHPDPSYIQFERNIANVYVGAYNPLLLDAVLGQFTMGDSLAAVNGLILRINDTVQMFQVEDPAGEYLELDIANGLYSIGDISGVANSTRMRIDDAAAAVDFRALAGQMMVLDQTAQQYAIGDLSLLGNGVVFQIDNGANEARIQNAGGNLLYINASVGLFFLGDDANGSGLAIDTAGQVYNIQDNGNPLFQGLFNGANPEVSIGDVNAIANGLFLQVDDATGIVRVQNAGMTAAMEINGVAGFTGTVAAPASITVNGGIVTNVT